MKYMEQGGFKNHPLMRLTLSFSVLFFCGLWITNFLLYFNKMGLTPGSVEAYYLGSDAEFTVARTYQSMLEITHFHLPMMALVVLMLTHLIIFAPFKDKTKTLIISASFLSAFLTEGSSWLVRFVHPKFSVLKIASFLTFQALLAYLLFALIIYLWSESSKKGRSKKPA